MRRAHKELSGGPAAIQTQLDQLKNLRPLYDNPFFNAALTFTEPFPIGLVVTLVSALILRQKGKPQSDQ